MVIDNFNNEYAFLSNFYEVPITWMEITYPSAEHAFQAAKTINPVTRMKIAAAPTPGQAKRMGRQVNLRRDWEDIKADIMFDIVREKFRQHPDLADKLLATGNAELIEGNNWHDTTWGVCNGVGKNWLGKILMAVRGWLQLEQGLNNDLKD